MPTQLGGLLVAAIGAAAATFWFVAMRAVGSGEAPPRLPDARTLGREARQRSRRLRGRLSERGQEPPVHGP